METELKPIVPSEMTPPLNPVLVTDEEGLNKVVEFLTREFVFGFDVETNFTPTFYNRRLRTIQIGNKNEQYVIDLLPFAGSPEALYAAQGDFGIRIGTGLYPGLDALVRALEPALNSKTYLKVGTNLQFDYMVMYWCLGVLSWNFYDCMLAEKVRWAGAVDFYAPNFWGLSDMVRRYCGLLVSKDEQKGFDLCTPLTQKQIDYAALDTRIVLAVKVGQAKFLMNDGLMQASTIEFDAVPAFGDMHLNGLLLDKDKWLEIIRGVEKTHTLIVEAMDRFFIPIVGSKEIPDIDLDSLEGAWRDTPSKTADDKVLRADRRRAYMEARKRINTLRKEATTYEGEAAINYGSNPQLKDALLRLKVGGKKSFTPAKLPDTGDQTLKKIAEHPKYDVATVFDDACDACKGKGECDVCAGKGKIEGQSKLLDCGIIDLIRLYRETKKTLTTYGVEFLEKHIHVDTGRIHSNINQLGAATGRTSSSKPNVQNIKREADWRHCFVARPGNVMCTLDYSGCELRILAELSGEKIWIDAFNNGWDVHSVGAEIMFGEEWKQGTEKGCAYYNIDPKDGKDHKQCKCKVHKALRTRAKNLNFGIALKP